jgi:putative ABC transport system permease protein
MNDLKIAFRNMGAHPSFSLLVIMMFSLGIAGNAAMFSIFNALFLRPLPFAESDRLVDVDETAPQWKLRYVGISGPDLNEWNRSNSTFDSMAFFRGATYNVADGKAVARINGAQVTRTMLDVLHLKPVLGRNFSPDEDRPGGTNVVLLRDSLWQRMFFGDPNILGHIVKLDEQPYVVIGVLPREAVFPDGAEFWTPLAADPIRSTGYYVNGIGRLKLGTSIEQARADLFRIHKAMIASGHKVNEITSPVLTPLRDRYLGDYRIVGGGLLAGVAMVLLIACVNIAALMFVRAEYRSREVAIRTAIGAPRNRLIGQLLVENAALVVAGGALGVALGAAALRMILPVLPASIPHWIDFSLDIRFAGFCVAITAVSALLFGLAPAIQASRVDLQTVLRNSASRIAGHRGRRSALAFLVAAEIGLALMLAISAGLLLESFDKVLRVNPGFRPDNVLTFRLRLPDTTYGDAQKKISYYNNLLDRLRTLPGIKSAGATSAPPLGGQWGGLFEAEGNVGRQGENPTVLQVAVTPGYFEAIGMTRLRGRLFEQRDQTPTAPAMVVVNETFAAHFWGATDPVGEHIRRVGGADWLQVIGVVRDEKHYGLDQDARPSVFLPYSTALRTALSGDERAFQEMSVILLAAGDPNSLARPASEIVSQMDPDVPTYAMLPMTERLEQSLWTRKAYSWLFGIFAAVALLLAGAGVYGIVSYSVSQRTQEIGIRIALGAQPSQVLRQVLRNGMALVSLGVSGGLLVAAWMTRLLQTLLFGISSYEPLAYGVGIVIVIGIALVANLVPALRAARIDPLRALHS